MTTLRSIDFIGGFHDNRSSMSGSRRESEGIDYFGRGHWLTDIQVRASLRMRREMFEAFLRFAGDLRGRTILDVGATPDTERGDSNCMVPWLIAAGAKVSLYSPEDIGHLESAYPGVKVVRENEWVNLKDQRCFDWVSSSAVIEHVGSEANQVSFLRELAGRGCGLFVTTPNRIHWMEFHTKLPLIHWLPKAAHRKLLKAMGMPLWADEKHLNLLSTSDFRRVAAKALGPEARFELHSAWFLGMPSNLFLLSRSSESA
jgi:hypothetical protein